MKKIFFYYGNGTGNGKIGVFNFEDNDNKAIEKDIENIKLMVDELFLVDEHDKNCDMEEKTRTFILHFPDGDKYPYKQNMKIFHFHPNLIVPLSLYEDLKKEVEKRTGIIKSGKFELDLGDIIIYSTNSMCISENLEILFNYDEMLIRDYQEYSFNSTSR
ncbi:hypothetical protein QUR79_10870 [Arcobacter cryaerophilus gv. pseudocryaerophilus]|uniref:Uncharacterized protein n=2 Tax=Arcobacteraceae TaxID=2808963 RepID=A0AAU0P4U0_9BACT|nr:hypothetical protein RJG54_07810 [Arcobacter sp. AZ-2023]WPD03243.1 hypothetical protein QUR79_10870 [Arcobacter sp. DSM 115972]